MGPSDPRSDDTTPGRPPARSAPPLPGARETPREDPRPLSRRAGRDPPSRPPPLPAAAPPPSGSPAPSPGGQKGGHRIRRMSSRPRQGLPPGRRGRCDRSQSLPHEVTEVFRAPRRPPSASSAPIFGSSIRRGAGDGPFPGAGKTCIRIRAGLSGRPEAERRVDRPPRRLPASLHPGRSHGLGGRGSSQG